VSVVVSSHHWTITAVSVSAPVPDDVVQGQKSGAKGATHQGLRKRELLLRAYTAGIVDIPCYDF
jgi:hypothetical protein